MSVPDELRRYVPRTDLYDSLELVHYHMPVEQPPASYSYEIFKKGNKTYAKNGTYGHIEYESTDAATTIQYALNQLANGGKIFIKAGTYTIGSTLTIEDKEDITIIGEGASTILQAETDIDILHIYYSSPAYTYMAKIQISGLHFKGISGHTHAGIRIADAANSKYGTHYTHIVNNYFTTLYRGIFSEGNSTDNNIIGFNNFHDIFYRAIELSDGSEENQVVGNNIDYSHNNVTESAGIVSNGHRNVIVGNTVEEMGWQSGVGDGLYITGNENVVVGNTVRECGRYGIVVGGNDNIIANNLVNDNYKRGINIEGSGHRIIGNTVTDNGDYNIWIYSGAGDNILIENNKVSGATTQILDNSGKAIIRGNQGYPTENEGIATFSGDGTTTTFNIPHGLVSTPTKYGVSPLTPDADAARTITADATNITITFDTAPPSATDNLKFGWWAKV